MGKRFESTLKLLASRMSSYRFIHYYGETAIIANLVNMVNLYLLIYLWVNLFDPLEVVSKGIPFVQSKIAQKYGREYNTAFTEFWKYFGKNWALELIYKIYKIENWNVFHLINDPNARDELANRTNNALERCNCNLNEEFLCAHPKMPEFIKTQSTACHVLYMWRT